MAEKITKAMWFETIKGIVEASDFADKAGAVEFIDAQLALLASKAEKAKERAAKAREKGDELREVVLSVLTDEFQSIDAITAQIEGEDVTKAKVTARLTQLVTAEKAVKDTIKGEDGRKTVHYKLADVVAAEDVE